MELSAELKAIENEILSLIGAETFDGCQTIINQLLGNLRRKEETKTLNKLNRLYKGTLKLPESLDQYVNLSKHRLTEPEKELLNLGLNCHVSSKFDRYFKATEMEILYDSILKLETDRKITVSAGFRDQLRGEATKVRGDGRSTLFTPHLWEAAKSLRNNEEIIVRKADKCNMFVVIDMDEYKSKLDSILSDTTKFEIVNRDPVKWRSTISLNQSTGSARKEYWNPW